MSIVVMISLSLATVTALLYVGALMRYVVSYEGIFEHLPANEHPFKCLYALGYALLEKVHFNYENRYARKLYKEIDVVLGKKYADFYLRVNLSGKVSLSLLLIPMVLILYALLQSPAIIIIYGLAEFVVIYYFDMKVSDEMKKRQFEIDRDLPSIISKLTLLVNAGMILKEAWSEVSHTGTSTLYVEMQQAVIQMQNGISEEDAYKEFSERCMSQKVKKFVGTLAQNIKKGNKDLVSYLKGQSEIAWTEKKEFIKQQGEIASSKLLIPIGIMFIGIIVMIVVPIFANFSF